MIPLFEPKLRQNLDGTLTIQLRLSDLTAELPVPDKYKTVETEGFREFYFLSVKTMMQGLKDLHKEKMLRIKRRDKRRGRKNQGTYNSRAPSRDDEAETSPTDAG